MSRRTLLRNLLWAIGGLITALLGVPVVGYFVSPALKQEETPWVPVAYARDIPPGVPIMVEYSERIKEGWYRTESRNAAWILTKDAQSYVIYDPRCTHLGCAYTWKPDRQQFFCPCHDGIFDIDGRVISGPPPRPLDRLEVKVEGGVIYGGRIIKGDSPT